MKLLASPIVVASTAALALTACPQSNNVDSRPTSSTTATAPTARIEEEPTPALRLPADVRPTAERIDLTIDPKKDSYSGVVEIELELDKARRVIWLHGRDLTVTAASVVVPNSAPIQAVWASQGSAGLASLTLPVEVPKGKATLKLAFTAKLAPGQKGIFSATEGDERYVFTQFEAIAARSGFPCFDEPSFKIPFTLSLTVPKDEVAVANTREVAREPVGDSLRFQFAPTPPLPSYLVAFAVGNLDIVSGPPAPPTAVRKDPLPIRLVTAHGRGKEGRYAVDHAGEFIVLLESYTGVSYPYDKLDLLAVPGKGGAMENPGAVTFGEYFLLFDEATAPIRQRRSYASIVAHEFAHMWVGDLVTMRWWDDLWLNEAFATWLAGKIAEQWDPKSEAETSLLRSIQWAMGTDALVSARQIRQPIETTDDIENAFDGITYQKGAGVLRMFERWAGEAAWQKGFNAYLGKHRFANAEADDFLDAESAATGKDVKSAFHTFLDQPGVPFLDVSVRCEASGPARLHLAQSRYLPLGSTGDPKKTWSVPVCVRFGKGKSDKPQEACHLLTAAEEDFTLPAEAGCPDWVFPNADGAGYYRFALAPPDLERLRKNAVAVPGTLTLEDKIAYASSIRAGYARGRTPFADTLEAAAPLAVESEPALAEEPMGYLSQARDWLRGDPLRSKVEAHVRKLYGPIKKKLGWKAAAGEPAEQAILRSSVLGFLISTGDDPTTRKEAVKLASAYLGIGKDGKLHPEVVDANLTDLVVSTYATSADAAAWDSLAKLFASSVEESDRRRLLGGLASARDKDLAARARALVLDPSLRDNEVLVPLWTQLMDDELRDDAWAWFIAHYDEVFARLSKHHGGVQLLSLATVFCDETRQKEVEAFFSPKVDSIEGGPRQLASTLETIQLCVARRKLQEPNVRAYFAR
ncbi:MAG: M1 family aminopeptidase [Polyangiaceae bacterium]